MADQGSEGFLSPWLRKNRFMAAMPFLDGYVLDYGCGSGFLASYIPHDRYLGVDIDESSLKQARLRFPRHRFIAGLPEAGDRFDSIASLAVIEHVSDPVRFLCSLRGYLCEADGACIVITTPHPSVDWIHHIGSRIGLFSRHANEEHEGLLDRLKLENAGKEAELKMIVYKRFLCDANQIGVFRKINL